MTAKARRTFFDLLCAPRHSPSSMRAFPTASVSARPTRRRWPRVLTIGGIVFLLVGSVGASVWWTTPDVTWLRRSNPTETAMMRYREEQLRRQGRPVRRLWTWVPLGRISPYLIQAVLIAEDDKFFHHEGFDWESMRKALETNLRRRRIVFGGSTITQQLAKNLFLSPERSLVRKLREAAIAYKLERTLSKKRILELYLNVVEWGPGVYGAEAAARTYFHESASELGLPEAIRLASVLPNPYRFSPLDDTHRRLLRKRQIIARRMFQRRWIDEATYRAVLAELGVRP
ncbi:MAG: monofunctional biosynthetic peptidoglycan transglycosylase [Acidobacteria bacterium]|nr:monofunctional biosynthetic peptidoglycan transglycosylase [Acidobacteriota bacterium]MDW7983428.1 monofunctional biosynthetic peptidoglycan transglycosylase [Acidobacteriota bacterium]